MKNLDSLEKAVKQAESKNRPQIITVIQGLEHRGQDESKFYTFDGQEFTGDRNSENVFSIEYDKNWKQPA